MFGDGYDGERFGEREKESRSEYYDIWRQGMVEADDVPDFMGDETAESAERKRRRKAENDLEDSSESSDEMTESDSFSEREATEPDTTTVAYKPPIAQVNNIEHPGELQNPADANSLENAGKMVNYGLDTASRIYGLNEVFRVLETLDETGRDADNPIGTFYERLARTPEQRANLYREIQRDTILISNGGEVEHEMNILVGLDDQNNFYDRTMEAGNTQSIEDEQQNQKSVIAIQAMKNLLKALETGADFAGLRKRAEAANMTPIDYLLREEYNPTLTYFLNQATGELSGNVEEITQTLANEEVRRADEEAAAAITKVAEPEQVDQETFANVHEKIADNILKGENPSDEEVTKIFQDEEVA